MDLAAQLSLLVAILLALFGAVDLLTGWLIDDRRLALALLGCAALSVVGSVKVRRVASLVREGGPSGRVSRARVALSVASMATAFVAGAALGYLMGGWVVAAVIPTFTALVVGLTVALGLRRRRRVARRASKVTH